MHAKLNLHPRAGWIGPIYDPPYQVEFEGASEYSDTTDPSILQVVPIPTAAFSNGITKQYLHFDADAHTALDRFVLEWSVPSMGTLYDSGFIYTASAVIEMPDKSTVPAGGASLIVKEVGSNWHSGYEYSGEVTKSGT
jgi:hypothetical protein